MIRSNRKSPMPSENRDSLTEKAKGWPGIQTRPLGQKYVTLPLALPPRPLDGMCDFKSGFDERKFCDLWMTANDESAAKWTLSIHSDLGLNPIINISFLFWPALRYKWKENNVNFNTGQNSFSSSHHTCLATEPFSPVTGIYRFCGILIFSRSVSLLYFRHLRKNFHLRWNEGVRLMLLGWRRAFLPNHHPANRQIVYWTIGTSLGISSVIGFCKAVCKIGIIYKKNVIC